MLLQKHKIYIRISANLFITFAMITIMASVVASASNTTGSTSNTSITPEINLFTVKDCLLSDFNIKVMHDTFAFGLFQNIISVEKKHCILKITHEKYKFMKTDWIIDVCRGPVHIKKNMNGLKVIKKDSYCYVNDQEDNSKNNHDKNLTDYCFEYLKIRSIIQDDGLIFANGDREDISSEHGKLYCSFLLVKKYLQDAFIFSLHNKYENNLNLLLESNSNPTPTPAPAPVSTPAPAAAPIISPSPASPTATITPIAASAATAVTDDKEKEKDNTKNNNEAKENKKEKSIWDLFF
ncbi:MAG: hypothetical protein HQK49_00845 [Oligoflexia bacterium]|nr:hypothetical protein [Oligoflexia bacterium]